MTTPECDPERVETVARVLHAAACSGDCGIGVTDYFRRLAAAAITADPPPAYPGVSGGVTVIGPECFANAEGSVICWRGVNFYTAEGKYAADCAALASPAPAPQTVTIDVSDARAGEPEDYRAVPVDAPEVLTGDAGRAAYPPAPAPQGGGQR